ncbi:hypothetical protein BS642_14835 [Chromobacterium violaceum]|nr:hypothetical protein BS642_14835 [Chromobacterium violaceum]
MAGRPETAPAYDQMRQVRQMPQAVAFIANRHTCQAYTQQGTRIQMTEAQCREEMNAPRFNPYVEVSREAPAPVAKIEPTPCRATARTSRTCLIAIVRIRRSRSARTTAHKGKGIEMEFYVWIVCFVISAVGVPVLLVYLIKNVR